MPKTVSKHRHTAFQRQHGRCFYCQAPMWLGQVADFAQKYQLSAKQAARFQCTAEHLQARQDGGKNTADNIVAACKFCNHTRHRCKRAPTPEAYKTLVRRRLARSQWHPVPIFTVKKCTRSRRRKN